MGGYIIKMRKRELVLLIIFFITFLIIYTFYLKTDRIWIWFVIIILIITFIYLIERVWRVKAGDSEYKNKIISLLERVREFLKELIP